MSNIHKSKWKLYDIYFIFLFSLLNFHIFHISCINLKLIFCLLFGCVTGYYTLFSFEEKNKKFPGKIVYAKMKNDFVFRKIIKVFKLLEENFHFYSSRITNLTGWNDTRNIFSFRRDIFHPAANKPSTLPAP